MAFKTYRDVRTGKVAEYPEDVGALFYDSLQEVDPDTLQCIDCAKHDEAVVITPLADTGLPVDDDDDDDEQFDTDYDKDNK